MASRNLNATTHISNVDKAAILVLALGERYAEDIVSQLDDEELKTLSRSMASVGRVDSDVVENVIEQFISKVAYSQELMGSISATEKLLRAALPPERVNAILEEIGGAGGGKSMWERLSQVSDELLANYLKNEYPQTISLILSKIDSTHASAVMAHFPDALNLEVMMRILKMETVQREVLDEIERTLHNEFITNLSRAQKRNSHEILADIFNHFDRNTETRLMEMLERQDYEAAEHVKSLMFTFEDLARIEPSGIQEIIRAFNKEVLAVALKGAQPQLLDIFLSNMSERAGRILQEDMNALGPMRLRKIEEAQQQLVGLAKEMADRGEIEILEPSADDNDQWVK